MNKQLISARACILTEYLNPVKCKLSASQLSHLNNNNSPRTKQKINNNSYKSQLQLLNQSSKITEQATSNSARVVNCDYKQGCEKVIRKLSGGSC